MKICNNCSSVNDDAVVKCIHCKMPNNFTFQGVTVVPAHEKKDAVSCFNCGSVEPGNGNKCIHCRFPLPAQPGSANTLDQSSSTQHLISSNQHSASRNNKFY